MTTTDEEESVNAFDAEDQDLRWKKAYKLYMQSTKPNTDPSTVNQLKGQQVSMFARQRKLCAAIPMDPPSQYLEEPLLEEFNEKSTKVHQHERS
jgi:hypothetical protein